MRHGNHRRSGPKADWVYRPNKWSNVDLGNEEAFQSGTYYTVMNVTTGAEGATAQVLYDSASSMGWRQSPDLDIASGQPQQFTISPSARPDSAMRGPLIHGCEIGVYVHVEPSVWSGNIFYYMGLRIIVARQDPDTGLALLEPGYSMWQNQVGDAMGEPAMFANGRENCWERRIFKNRKTNETAVDDFWHHRFLPFKRRLNAHEGLFLYMELHPNGLGLTGNNYVSLWCRTLVTDTNRT